MSTLNCSADPFPLGQIPHQEPLGHNSSYSGPPHTGPEFRIKKLKVFSTTRSEYSLLDQM
jgi:hypothetical protein